LVEASSQNPKAGPARRVYRVTRLGERVLRVWMGVIKEEHDYLGGVLRRYQATGTTDAVLAEVEGGWALALGSGWSPVSPTVGAWRRLMSVDATGDSTTGDSARALRVETGTADRGPIGDDPERQRFRLVADRSVVLIEVRSTVGPLSFGAIGVTGEVRAALSGGALCTDCPPSARLEIDVSGLSSGNSLYDVELQRRIDARRYPITTVELRECQASGPGARYRLSGDLTFHGVTRSCEGTVHVEEAGSRLLITGEQVFDIRDFAIPLPTVLMLRIYPDIRVRLHAEAELEDAP